MYYCYLAFLMTQMVKNLPAMQILVRSLGQKDPLEKEMATHFNILAWEIPWTEEPGGLQFHSVAKSDTVHTPLGLECDLLETRDLVWQVLGPVFNNNVTLC